MPGVRIEEPEAAEWARLSPRFSGRPLMRGIFLIFLYRDDVMMDRCCV